MKISATVFVPNIGIISTNLSVTVNVSSTPWIKISSCATSVMCVLSLIATEKAIKAFISFYNTLSKSTKRSETLSAMVFLVRQTFAKTRRFSGHTISAACTMNVFINSPSLNGFEATAISLAMRWLAFTAASLMSRLLAKTQTIVSSDPTTVHQPSLFPALKTCHICRHEDWHSGDKAYILSAMQHAENTSNILLFHSLRQKNRRMTNFLGTICVHFLFFFDIGTLGRNKKKVEHKTQGSSSKHKSKTNLLA